MGRKRTKHAMKKVAKRGNAVEVLTANREYKDTVFRMLFSDKKELLSLYNALNGTNYESPEDLEITTLKNAIYMTAKNDISCVIDMRLNLYEHQSTVNPNIPLRDLDYVARTFLCSIEMMIFIHHGLFGYRIQNSSCFIMDWRNSRQDANIDFPMHMQI